MELKEAILTRRSVRKYKDLPVPREVLQDILETAVWAPSGVDTQPWYFLALTKPEHMEKLRSMVKRGFAAFRPVRENRFKNNPEIVVETENFITTLGNAPNYILAFYNRPDLESNPGTQSVAAAMNDICLLAREKGLGTCWMTAILEAREEIEAEFGAGKGPLVAGIAIGYPDQMPRTPKRKSGRFDIL